MEKAHVPYVDPEILEDVKQPLLAAVDLGSTSIAAYLMDGLTGRRLSVRSMLNPQKKYGADVVTRSSYALEHGAGILSGCAGEAVNHLLREAAGECRRSSEDIVRIVMVGNTCMHHLFLNIPTDTLVVAPHEPRVKKAVKGYAVDYGILVHPSAELWWLPNIGGFVGADTVGCILASGLCDQEELVLLVDIGTNAELVLGSRGRRIACSTAAGSAFEGVKTSCGMRGSEGAINHVTEKDGRLLYHVIGESEPVGICGSGLLDAAACLLKMGVIDESGRMERPWHFTPKVAVSQNDIRELQLAKAAIAAGIRLLCRHYGAGFSDIREVLLAGVFGNEMDPSSACAVGLFPAEFKGRIRPVGNAAGEGAQRAALHVEEFEACSRLAEETEFLELARDRAFPDIFIEELMFPV
ncbi:MAG: ASKHA domain-containing protein [Lachnospiraceae bacterium]